MYMNSCLFYAYVYIIRYTAFDQLLSRLSVSVIVAWHGFESDRQSTFLALSQDLNFDFITNRMTADQ